MGSETKLLEYGLGKFGSVAIRFYSDVYIVYCADKSSDWWHDLNVVTQWIVIIWLGKIKLRSTRFFYQEYDILMCIYIYISSMES